MIILDSSFIVSYFNKRDENHLKAIKFMKDIVNLNFGLPHITDYIFDETITVSFIRLKNLRKVEEIGDNLLKTTKLIEVEKTNFDNAWNLFKKQKNTSFSFTDCTTVSVMEESRIKNIATFDKDFEKIKGINIIGL